MATVLLVRHGATDWNATNRAQGHADIELNEDGRAQARAAAERLSEAELEAVFSSDLRRALDTARPIAEVHGLDVAQDPGFREIDQGDWTGLTTEEIRVRWPEHWGAERYLRTRPGGESAPQVRARALLALGRVVESCPDGRVAVVSHGVTIRMLVAESLGLDDRGASQIRGLPNGGVVTLDATRGDGERVVLGRPTRWDGRAPQRDDPNQ